MQRIIAYIRSLFTTEKTVDKTMETFTKTIDELRVIEAEASNRAWKIEEQINKLRDEQDEQDRESSKAGDLAEKLEAIFR